MEYIKDTDYTTFWAIFFLYYFLVEKCMLLPKADSQKDEFKFLVFEIATRYRNILYIFLQLRLFLKNNISSQILR